MVACVRFEIVPQLPKRTLEDLPECRRAEIRQPSSCFVGKPGNRVRAKAIGKVLMKVAAIRVLCGATRPVDQATVRAVDRLEPIGGGGTVDDQPEIARWNPSFAGEHTLVVGRDPFDLPQGKKEVGVEDRRSPEYVPQRTNPSTSLVEMHDVGVLVRQDQSKPVIGIPDGVVARWSRRIDLNRVEWHRCRPAVREIVLV